MRGLSYLIKRNIINSLKELKKHPAKLILYVAIVALLIFSVAAGSHSNKTNILKKSNSLFHAIALGFVVFMMYTSASQGKKNGASFFKLSDVNFLFTAPIRPQAILIYGFVKQLYVSFIFIFFLLFQIPNLYNFFNIKSYGAIFIFIGIFILVFVSSIISVITYSVASISPKHRKAVDLTLYGLITLAALGFLYQLLFYKDIYSAVIVYLNLDFTDYIPVIGWIMKILMTGFYGFSISTLLYIALCLAFSVLMCFVLYKINMDYYEDAIAATERREAILAKSKQGLYSMSSTKKNVKKVKNGFVSFGAKAILDKCLLEAKKEGILFVDKRTFLFLISSGIFSLFSKGIGVTGIFYFSVYLLLIFSIQSKWNMELKRHYVYLMPQKSSSIIFYSTVTDHIKNLVDGLAIFLVCGILLKANPITIILCTICYASFGSVYLYADMLLRRIFGVKISPVIEPILKIFIFILIVVPGIVVGLLVSVSSAQMLSYLIMIAYNCIIDIICILLSRKLFENIEMR
ncbi:putative ABC exporter domain-containing protein [Clostridium sp. 19966]|uniref:putative ABC exporter domain-containing protein n=1 Tax=Clostridium sp. 19966 TaxID=2768166 RepID=UPI0028DD5286|nr:putative ABC exporter domain-containing protein [Clostridium sp. 19966]MDT8718848.1 putative ABC exporter domain-containing protein [Clostridium sp. 19966]